MQLFMEYQPNAMFFLRPMKEITGDIIHDVPAEGYVSMIDEVLILEVEGLLPMYRDQAQVNYKSGGRTTDPGSNHPK